GCRPGVRGVQPGVRVHLSGQPLPDQRVPGCATARRGSGGAGHVRARVLEWAHVDLRLRFVRRRPARRDAQRSRRRRRPRLMRRNFTLGLAGGSLERRWRKLRPGVEAFDWTLPLARFSTEELVCAQRLWTMAALKEHASAAAHALLVRALVRAQAP